MQIVQAGGVTAGEGPRQEVGLLLVVALQCHPVTGTDHVVQQVVQFLWVDHFRVGVGPAGGDPFSLGGAARVPAAHRSAHGRHHRLDDGCHGKVVEQLTFRYCPRRRR